MQPIETTTSEPGPATAGAPCLEDVFRAHADAVLRWAARLGGPKVDAEDVLQEVFLVVQKKLPRFLEEQGKLTTWLYRITENVVLHHRRRNRWREWLGGSAEEVAGALPSSTSPEGDVEAHQRRAEVYRVLDAMKEPYRTVLILFELEQLSGEEIAERTGRKVGTIWVQLHRARAEFLKRMPDRDGAEVLR